MDDSNIEAKVVRELTAADIESLRIETTPIPERTTDAPEVFDWLFKELDRMPEKCGYRAIRARAIMMMVAVAEMSEKDREALVGELEWDWPEVLEWGRWRVKQRLVAGIKIDLEELGL